MSGFSFGAFIGFMYSLFVLPASHKEECRFKFTMYPILYNSMIIIPLNSTTALHIHHWVPYTLILLFFRHLLFSWMNGFCFMLIVNGLCYKDRFEFITENPYK